jgi:hypothetical protein
MQVEAHHRRSSVVKILRVCLGSRYSKVLVIGAILAVVGLLAWGLAPKLIVSALPLLAIAACLLPCLLPLYWLRCSPPSPTNPNSPGVEDRQPTP